MKSLEQRLEVLADAARYDASCAVSVADPRSPRQNELGIYQSVGPDGGRLALLKILLTNECVYALPAETAVLKQKNSLR